MTRTRTLPANHPEAISSAVEVIESGGTVVFPTDTVYGLASSAFNPRAIQKLFEIKAREQGKPIAVLLGDVKQLKEVTQNPSRAALELADKHWPGALTLVVPRHPALPDILSPLPTLGVRIPDHPVALAFLKATGPLAVTSANLSGKENTTTAQEAFAQLNGRADLILDGGKTPGGVPSTVVDMTGPKPKIIRQGPVGI
ncbi:MAG: threonylcarbamoyl-AMP synthase [Anaerolineales bacterium]|nr:threonylcarbamoyl-AMP synthase [Anaerolineales bacterium]